MNYTFNCAAYMHTQFKSYLFLLTSIMVPTTIPVIPAIISSDITTPISPPMIPATTRESGPWHVAKLVLLIIILLC